jgi:hypothetical protein
VAYDGHGRLGRYVVGAATQTMLYNGEDERIRVVTTPAVGLTDTRIYIYDLDHRIVGEYGLGGVVDLRAEYIWTLPEVDFANAKQLAGALHYDNRSYFPRKSSFGPITCFWNSIAKMDLTVPARPLTPPTQTAVSPLPRRGRKNSGRRCPFRQTRA